MHATQQRGEGGTSAPSRGRTAREGQGKHCRAGGGEVRGNGGPTANRPTQTRNCETNRVQEKRNTWLALGREGEDWGLGLTAPC